MTQRRAFRFVLGVSVLGLLLVTVSAVAGVLGSREDPVTPEARVTSTTSSTTSTTSDDKGSGSTQHTESKPRLREAGAATTTSSTADSAEGVKEAPKPTTPPTTAPKKVTTTPAPQTTNPPAEQGAPPVEVPAGAVHIAPGQSIQAAVDSHPANTTFVIGSGVHRRQQVTPKDGNRFVGESGAVLDGERSARHAFSGYARSVVIEGLVIRNYANPLETGAVTGGSSWVVRGNEISNNKGGGVFASDGWTVANNNIHHNGQIGVLANGRGITISGNTIANNNTDNHDSHWEAGGTKFFGQATSGLVVKNNRVSNNNGPGLWTDFVGNNTLYEGNVVVGNAGPGIFHEISGSAIIRGNHVEGNGDGPAYKPWIDGAGILVNSSRDTQVIGNTVKNNNDGIGLVESGRANGLRNITVKNNTVTLRSGALNGAVATSDSAAASMGSWNLVFDGNRYSGGGGQNFAWGGSYISWDAWRAAGQDPSGSFN